MFMFTATNKETGEVINATNDINGNIQFSPFNFKGLDAGTKDNPKVYTFDIVQATPSSDTINFDSAKYTAQFSLYDEFGDANLVSNVKYFDENGIEVSSIEFSNSFGFNDLPEAGMFNLTIAYLVGFLLLVLLVILLLFRSSLKTSRRRSINMRPTKESAIYKTIDSIYLNNNSQNLTNKKEKSFSEIKAKQINNSLIKK